VKNRENKPVNVNFQILGQIAEQCQFSYKGGFSKTRGIALVFLLRSSSYFGTNAPYKWHHISRQLIALNPFFSESEAWVPNYYCGAKKNPSILFWYKLLDKTFIFEGWNQHPSSPCNLGQSLLRQSLSEPDHLGILHLPWWFSLYLVRSKPLEKSIISWMVWSGGQFSSELQND